MKNFEHGLVSRRSILGAASLGTAAAVVGLGSAPASAHGGTVVKFNEIWSAPIYYNGSNTIQEFDPTFYNRLETWMPFYYSHAADNWLTPMKINHLGVHDHDPTTSWHYHARAIDLQDMYFTDANTGSLFKAFDCRWKYTNSSGATVGWHKLTGSALTTTRKRYWAAIAGLQYHFRDVLHYLYNSEHWNHVHVDNGLSGSGNSNFSTGSTAQVKAVQACLVYIWGYTAVTIDGDWGPQTDSYSKQALTRIGRTGGLTTSQANWLEFNKASLRFGTGKQTY